MSGMNRCVARCLQLACVGLIALVGGCNEGPRTYRIPGKLVYEDNSVVPGGSVVLQTTIDGQIISARGMASTDGKFELSTFKAGDGVVAGEHQVAVSPLPAAEGAKPARPPVPSKYWDFTSSGLQTTVTPETKEIVITINRAGR